MTYFAIYVNIYKCIMSKLDAPQSNIVDVQPEFTVTYSQLCATHRQENFACEISHTGIVTSIIVLKGI